MLALQLMASGATGRHGVTAPPPADMVNGTDSVSVTTHHLSLEVSHVMATTGRWICVCSVSVQVSHTSVMASVGERGDSCQSACGRERR